MYGSFLNSQSWIYLFWLVAVEYMSLPASQYSVLDAERIERVDDNTFRCYVYRFRFFAFEVCPVLMVKVEEQPNGCCIRLLSCKVCGLCSLFFVSWFYALLVTEKKKKKQEERRRFKISDSGFLIVWGLSNGANVN